jgi:hypothetical protein
MIGRQLRPIPSHSLLYNLPPVPWLMRYSRRRCLLSQREYILNHIEGNLGLVEYPIQIVVSDPPHLFTRLLLKISLFQRKKLSSHSCTLPKSATMYFALVCSLMASSNELTHSEFKWMEFQRGECLHSHAPL